MRSLTHQVGEQKTYLALDLPKHTIEKLVVGEGVREELVTCKNVRNTWVRNHTETGRTHT